MVHLNLIVKRDFTFSGMLIGIKHLIFHPIWTSWHLALRRLEVRNIPFFFYHFLHFPYSVSEQPTNMFMI